jgi:hypothetical protein
MDTNLGGKELFSNSLQIKDCHCLLNFLNILSHRYFLPKNEEYRNSFPGIHSGKMVLWMLKAIPDF